MKTSAQVADIYTQRGIDIPVELSSTLHSLSYRDGASLTEIAAVLDQPHQLVAQRVKKLIAQGLVVRRRDPDDKRRFELTLTENGAEQARKLRQCMRDMARVYSELYVEIGCDLPAKLVAAMEAISTRSLADRFDDMARLRDTKEDRTHVQ